MCHMQQSCSHRKSLGKHYRHATIMHAWNCKDIEIFFSLKCNSALGMYNSIYTATVQTEPGCATYLEAIINV